MNQDVKLEFTDEIPKGRHVRLLLTDIKLHTKVMNPSSVGKNIIKSIETGQPGRIYTPFPKDFSITKEIVILDNLKNDLKLQEAIEEYQKKGMKIYIEIPEGGIPIYFGDDAIEFFKGVKGKRLIRVLDKNSEKS